MAVKPCPDSSHDMTRAKAPADRPLEVHDTVTDETTGGPDASGAAALSVGTGPCGPAAGGGAVVTNDPNGASTAAAALPGEKETLEQEPALSLLAAGGGPKHILVMCGPGRR
mmetsp:Transcript_17952/g.27442  ORF Transcript_17952/g.27442 Transcript_17952/m.27442 type:complete len:112 (-) Transcript_17952:16-351(-)